MTNRTTILVLATLLLTACSSVQLAYNNADLVVGAYVENLLDLDDTQMQAWQPVLDEALARHRDTELPAVVALLGAMKHGAATGYTEAGLRCLVDHAWQRWRVSATLVAQASAPLLTGLRAEQIERIRERLRESDAEFREEHLAEDSQERQAARVTRVVKRIERWTGRLDGQQRALVARHVAAWPPLAQGWRDYRAGQWARLIALLETGADTARVEHFLIGWWATQAGMPPALLEGRRRVEAGLLSMIAELHATLGREQDEHLVESFDELQRSLAGLASEGKLASAIDAMRCDGGAGTAAT